MADQSQKTPLARTLEQFAQRKVQGALALAGQSLPASVVSVVSSGVVTVKFELTGVPYTLPNITVPMIGSEYIRLPIQAGCLGWVMTADAYLGGMSGLGGGTADLSQRANLSTLVWSPIGNKGWSSTDDQNKLVIYGPDGVIIRDLNKKTVLTLTASGIVIDLQAGDAVTINGNLIVSGNLQLGGAIQSQPGSTYSGDIKTAGNVIAGDGGADQIGLQTHKHSGVQTGGGQSGSPVAGT